MPLPMKSLKHVLHLLTGKSAPTISSAALSSAEMDHLFGGKPAEIISEQAYWWIEDEDSLPSASPDANTLPSRT